MISLKSFAYALLGKKELRAWALREVARNHQFRNQVYEKLALDFQGRTYTNRAQAKLELDYSNYLLRNSLDSLHTRHGCPKFIKQVRNQQRLLEHWLFNHEFMVSVKDLHNRIHENYELGRAKSELTEVKK